MKVARSQSALFLLLIIVILGSLAAVPVLSQTYVTRATVTTNGFLPAGEIDPAENCESFIIRSSPATLEEFLASLRGLPANAEDRFVCSYDLRANTTYTLDLRDAFGLTCDDVVIYKVNFDATAGQYNLATCARNVVTFNHRGGDATFVILGA